MGPDSMIDRSSFLCYFWNCKVASDVLDDVNLMYSISTFGMWMFFFLWWVQQEFKIFIDPTDALTACDEYRFLMIDTGKLWYIYGDVCCRLIMKLGYWCWIFRSRYYEFNRFSSGKMWSEEQDLLAPYDCSIRVSQILLPCRTLARPRGRGVTVIGIRAKV